MRFFIFYPLHRFLHLFSNDFLSLCNNFYIDLTKKISMWTWTIASRRCVRICLTGRQTASIWMKIIVKMRKKGEVEINISISLYIEDCDHLIWHFKKKNKITNINWIKSKLKSKGMRWEEEKQQQQQHAAIFVVNENYYLNKRNIEI